MYLLTNKTVINLQNCKNYFVFQKHKNAKNINIYSNLLASEKIIQDCDTIVYYWPKNKDEAKFQLINIMSCIPINREIFIVGENQSGVKSAYLILKKWIQLTKIDNAKHSNLFLGILKKKTDFSINNFFKIHQWKNFYIKSLPGVFGHKKIDEGSKLLTSTFSKNMNGKILDVGSGTGFLSISFLYYSPNAKLTLLDNNLTAIKCSQETLDFNQLTGEVIYSDLYSNISQKFDLIISNPSFHEDRKISFSMTEKIISDAVKYLNLTGELRFVTNKCYSYSFFLKKVFKKHFIIKENENYKVYQAFLK